MKPASIFTAFLCFATLLFVSFASPKNTKLSEAEGKAVTQEQKTENESEKEADALENMAKTVIGVLLKSENESYSVVTKIKSKSRTDYHLVMAEGHEKAYSELDSFVGKRVCVTGNVIERKNPWNWTISVTDVELR